MPADRETLSRLNLRPVFVGVERDLIRAAIDAESQAVRNRLAHVASPDEFARPDLAGNGERRVAVQPIAVKLDGTRVPVVERQAERFLRSQAAQPRLSDEERLSLFATVVEPTLQRELKHKGAAIGDGSYLAELIGYAELI
jgi:hypothetical protein